MRGRCDLRCWQREVGWNIKDGVEGALLAKFAGDKNAVVTLSHYTHFDAQRGACGEGARSGLRERVMTDATKGTSIPRSARTKTVSHLMKPTVAVELLREQHGEANAWKIALQEQRKARRARSRRRFEFWGAVAMLMGQECTQDGRPLIRPQTTLGTISAGIDG